MQQLHPAIYQSGPLTRADLSITGFNPTPTRRNLKDGEQFRERHEGELADLRSQILELKQSQSAKIDQSGSSLSPI